MCNILPELGDIEFQNAANLLEEIGWFSEYSPGVPFYISAVVREFLTEIKMQFLQRTNIPLKNIDYTEVNARGVNGWAFYDNRRLDIPAARDRLERETIQANNL